MAKLHDTLDNFSSEPYQQQVGDFYKSTPPIADLIGNIRLLNQQGPYPLHMATTTDEINEIQQLRARTYKDVYPSIDTHIDDYDKEAIIYYSRNLSGQVDSTARLVSNEGIGMPEEYLFSKSIRDRLKGKRVFELGRFIVENGSLDLLKQYYKTFYSTTKALGADYILMVMKNKDISLHRRIMNVQVLTKDVGTKYGGKHTLACVIWDIHNTPDSFFNWVGV